MECSLFDAAPARLSAAMGEPTHIPADARGDVLRLIGSLPLSALEFAGNLLGLWPGIVSPMILLRRRLNSQTDLPELTCGTERTRRP